MKKFCNRVIARVSGCIVVFRWYRVKNSMIKFSDVMLKSVTEVEEWR